MIQNQEMKPNRRGKNPRGARGRFVSAQTYRGEDYQAGWHARDKKAREELAVLRAGVKGLGAQQTLQWQREFDHRGAIK